MANARLCSIEGCDKPTYCRQVCRKHYCRIQRHGDPKVCLRPKSAAIEFKAGQVFGRLKLLGREASGRRNKWLLVCECGTEVLRDTQQLKSGASRDCGCSRRETHDALGRLVRRHVDLPIGAVFGRLTVLGGEAYVGKNYWVNCRCDCGKEVRCRVDALKSGKKLQCGAHPREVTEAQRRATAARNRTHGMSRTPEYNAWLGARKRCQNPNDDRYADYGGRGIKICDRWNQSFEQFLADMGPRPGRSYSLDRINVDGDYEPGNCRWADADQQARNRRPFLIRPRAVKSTCDAPPFIPPPPLEAGAYHTTRHGFHGTPEYQAWSAMKARCNNPRHRAYRNYGGRGVNICDDWQNSFEAFISHVGMRPGRGFSLDRIDNERGYEPGNVRWANRSTQNQNRRPFMIRPGRKRGDG